MLMGMGATRGGSQVSLSPLPAGEHPAAGPASPREAVPPALALAELLGATGLGVLAREPQPGAWAGGGSGCAVTLLPSVPSPWCHWG